LPRLRSGASGLLRLNLEERLDARRPLRQLSRDDGPESVGRLIRTRHVARTLGPFALTPDSLERA
jgi:hypothetical protein